MKIFKRYTSLFFAVMTAICLFSCREKEIGCIVADRTDFVFDCHASGQSGTVTGGADLRAVSDQGWCAATFSGEGMDNLLVRVLANPDVHPRYATVTLSASGCENVQLKVTQNGLGDSDLPYLMAEKDKIEVGNKPCSEFVTIYTNQDAVAVISHPDWCIAELLRDKDVYSLKINFAANGSNSDRAGKIVLRAGECEDLVLELVQSAQKNADCELLSFEIKADGNGLRKDIRFEIDNNTLTLDAKYLYWIEKESPEMLIPTFTIKGRKVFVGDQEMVSGATAISFADDFDLFVWAENGDIKTYRVSLNCPQINRELPVLHIKPDMLINNKEYYVQTYINLYDKTPESTGEGWWDSAEKGKIEMRGRGNSTWGLPKKPFRMKFTEEFSPIGLNHAREKSWVLMAQDMDKSLIRNCIAFEYSRVLFNAAENYHHEKALNFTPCMKLINVYFTGDYYYSDTRETRHLDGEYLGVYQMSDQMQRKPGRIAVDKLKAIDGSDPDKITGGYIIETDIHEGNHYSPYKRVKMTYKYPEDDDYDPAQYSYITDFIGKAENALYSSNFRDPDNGWRRYMDEKTLADYIILKELVQDMDGYTSTYMYKRRGVDKLFFGPVWDCDKGWDNDKRVPHWQYQPLSSLMIHAGFWMNAGMDNDWFQRVWQDETFRAFVAKRWADKKDELLAVTNRLLDEIPAGAAKAIDANFTVWKFYYQYSSEAKMPAKTYPEEIERIRKLTQQRAALLDKLFNQ